MKKTILCVSVATILLSVLALSFFVTAKEPATNPIVNNATAPTVENYISNIYKQINFKDNNKMSFEAFSTAMRGYLNLKNAGKLNNSKPVLTVADFSLSSTKKRLWIIDMNSKQVLLNDYVAHGQGSGDEFATSFSNKGNSHQSSLGFYVTGDIYYGNHGKSMRLHGMDEGFNSAAFERAVVVHAADYVSPSFIAGQNRLGRSWGCPAVSNQSIGKVINYTEGGTCLFVYAPQKNYLASSSWLNKSVNHLPEDYMTQDMNPAMIAMNGAKRDTVYEYGPGTEMYNPANASSIAPKR
jgi:hypothetical protein